MKPLPAILKVDDPRAAELDGWQRVKEQKLRLRRIVRHAYGMHPTPDPECQSCQNEIGLWLYRWYYRPDMEKAFR